MSLEDKLGEFFPEGWEVVLDYGDFRVRRPDGRSLVIESESDGNGVESRFFITDDRHNFWKPEDMVTA